MANRLLTFVSFISIFAHFSNGQWSRWDDTDFCYPEVANNPSHICCQGVVYDDPNVEFACCDRQVCSRRTGRPVNPSSLHKIKEVQRMSYVVRTEPPGPPPMASADIEYVYPRLVSGQQLSLQNPQQAQVPFQLQKQPQIVQRQPGPQPIVVSGGGTGTPMNADPRFLQPNEMFPEAGPVRLGRVDELFDQAIPLGPVEEGDWNVVAQVPPQQQYQPYQQYQLQPVQLGATGGPYGLPVFLQGPQPLNKVPQRNDPSPIEQRQMPSSYTPL